MMVLKLGNKVEISGIGLHLCLPANIVGYKLLAKQNVYLAEKYKVLFVEKRS